MNIAAIVASIVIAIFGFAGGGGSSSSGGGGGGGSYSSSSYSSSYDSDSYDDGEFDIWDAIVLLIFIGIIGATAIFNRSNKKRTLAKPNSANNSTPEEKFIHEEAKRIFEQYQKDWTEFNYQSIAKYATKDYCAHASLMLDLLHDLHRVNKVSKLKVNWVYLPVHVDANTTLPLNLRIEFGFEGLDEVIDTASGKKLFSQMAKDVTETWNFVYDGKSLKLAGISQPTESSSHLIQSLANFAHENKMYYSPDWGRYALPSRGLIFGGATMSVSDVNNHVIGKWGDLLIQLYSYSAVPNIPSTYYIVGQINVPKEYLGVIVRSKHTSANPDKSYEKFEMEWPDFNKRYDVYAAKRDALPAFELLNPKFMEFLYDKNPNYSLEVVDNVIYIFANVTRVTEQDYADLLEVLRRAYDELKM